MRPGAPGPEKIYVCTQCGPVSSPLAHWSTRCRGTVETYVKLTRAEAAGEDELERV